MWISKDAWFNCGETFEYVCENYFNGSSTGELTSIISNRMLEYVEWIKEYFAGRQQFVKIDSNQTIILAEYFSVNVWMSVCQQFSDNEICS